MKKAEERKDGVFVEDIARQLWGHYAVVFVGAGFSRNADSSYPLWANLADKMWGRLHSGVKVGPYVDVMRLAEEYQAAFDRPQLDSLLLSSCHKPNCPKLDLHCQLLSLPWVDVLTTNYDTLLEQAAGKISSIRYSPVYNKADLSVAQRPRIIKLHGSFPSERPFIITARDYRSYPYDHASFVNTVRQSILENTLVLIGFSGDDPNFLSWLEWAKIQQGFCNVRKIYLIEIQHSSYSRRRMLAEQGIECHDIDEYYEAGGDAGKAFKSFFEDLAKRNTRVDEWPHILTDAVTCRRAHGDQETILQVSRQIAQLRETFPGWVVPPAEAMQRIFFSFNLVRPLLPDENVELTTKLDYLHLLFWLYEVSLSPYPKTLIEAAEILLRSFEDPTNDVTVKLIDIELGILRAERERGEISSWPTALGRLKSISRAATARQKVALAYEICLRDLLTLDYLRLPKHIAIMDVSSVEPIWAVRKARLFLEVGSINNAIRLLWNVLETIRMMRPQDGEAVDCATLSAESAALTLLHRINKTAAVSERKMASETVSMRRKRDDVSDFVANLLKPCCDYAGDQYSIDADNAAPRPDADPRSVYDRQYELGKYKCDMTELGRTLKSVFEYDIAKTSRAEERSPFDITELPTLGGRTWDYFHIWRQTAYVRFYDMVGWPWRIKKFIFGDPTCLSLSLSASYHVKGLVLPLMATLGIGEVFDMILTRKFLFELGEEVRAACIQNLIDYAKRELDAPVCALREGTIELLSRFVVCAKANQRKDLASLIRSIYAGASRLSYAPYDKLVTRYVQTLTDADMLNVARILIDTPYDRLVNARQLSRLPNVLAQIARRHHLKMPPGVIDSEVCSKWIAQMNSRDMALREWATVNLLAVGHMGGFDSDQIHVVAKSIKKMYPDYSVMMGFSIGSDLIFAKPWVGALNVADHSARIMNELCCQYVRDFCGDESERLREQRRRLAFVSESVGSLCYSPNAEDGKRVLCRVCEFLSSNQDNFAHSDSRDFVLDRAWCHLGRQMTIFAAQLLACFNDVLKPRQKRLLREMGAAEGLRLTTMAAVVSASSKNRARSLLLSVLNILREGHFDDNFDAVLATLVLLQRDVLSIDLVIGVVAGRFERKMSKRFAHRLLALLIACLKIDRHTGDGLPEAVSRISSVMSCFDQDGELSESDFSLVLLLCKDLNGLRHELLKRAVDESPIIALLEKKNSILAVFKDLEMG